MKASELRIGNWLQRLDGSLFQVNEHDFKILAHDLPDNLHPKPIPLTEEWLLKFGFEMDGNSSRLKINNRGWIWFHHRKNGVYCELGTIGHYQFSPVDCQHVHQLQNLYFALTGEELTVNEK